MALKLQTGQSRTGIDQILARLGEMERITRSFQGDALSFSESVQDETSRAALSIIEEILSILRSSKKIVEESGKKASEGIEKLEEVEARARMMRGKI